MLFRDSEGLTSCLVRALRRGRDGKWAKRLCGMRARVAETRMPFWDEEWRRKALPVLLPGFHVTS